MSMFSDKELQGTKEYCAKNKRDILKSNAGSDLDYIKNLQTLIQLENAADEFIQENNE